MPFSVLDSVASVAWLAGATGLAQVQTVCLAPGLLGCCSIGLLG